MYMDKSHNKHSILDEEDEYYLDPLSSLDKQNVNYDSIEDLLI